MPRTSSYAIQAIEDKKVYLLLKLSAFGWGTDDDLSDAENGNRHSALLQRVRNAIPNMPNMARHAGRIPPLVHESWSAFYKRRLQGSLRRLQPKQSFVCSSYTVVT